MRVAQDSVSILRLTSEVFTLAAGFRQVIGGSTPQAAQAGPPQATILAVPLAATLRGVKLEGGAPMGH